MSSSKKHKKRNKHQKHLDQVVNKTHRDLVRIAKRKKSIVGLIRKLENNPVWLAVHQKKWFIENFYKRNYKPKKSTSINIEGEFGFETSEIIENSLNYATQIIDFDTEYLFLDISNATRIWPSAITLLCSLKQSAELCSTNPRPKISSNTPIDDKVSSYLTHCGFWRFVNATEDQITQKYNDDEGLKIKRQNDHNRATQETIDDEISKVLKKYSILKETEIERFGDRILIEILSNASEHGISHRDEGWWVIMQYHPIHKVISLAIADNGIGFRNNLMTGLQKEDINLSNDPEKDGDFIRYALDNVITGAISQVPRITYKGILFKEKMPARGSHRGKGLGTIKNECKSLKIRLSILSQYGYIFLDEDGNTIKCGSQNKRIFAGTMYHLLIRAK